MKESPQKQIIIGLHSIKAAIDNSHRVCLELIGTDDGFKNLNKLHRLSKQILEKKVRKVAQLTAHEFQQVAQAYFRDLGFEFQRIASGVLLVVSPLPFLTWQELGKIAGQKNIVALDQVTDIHNAAAIIRTCAFYGVGALILESKGSFNITPGLSRIASGGLETIPLFITSGLPATLRKLRESGVRLIGLSAVSYTHLTLPTILRV